MTFYASNSRIQVTDTTGETVFDTDENMPHIVKTQYITNVSVDYPNIASTQVYLTTIPYSYYYCPPAYIVYETITPSCYTTYSYAYYYDYYYGYSSGGLVTTYYCPPSYTNSYYVTPPCQPFTYYYDVYQAQYQASEYSGSQILASYPTDENGNSVDIDFIIIQASGVRTVAGRDTIINDSLLTTVPEGTFSFQGSVLLESAGLSDGKSYLRRILSVLLDNTTKQVILKKQATTRTATTGQGSQPSMASSFNFNFKIFFGKFKT